MLRRFDGLVGCCCCWSLMNANDTAVGSWAGPVVGMILLNFIVALYIVSSSIWFIIMSKTGLRVVLSTCVYTTSRHEP